MSELNAAVAVYAIHPESEEAIRVLQHSGIDMRSQSIVGKDSHIDEQMSVIRADWQAERLAVALTKQQVENSPDINTRQPVSRRHESAYLGSLGYPFFWGGPYLCGTEFSPAVMAVPATTSTEALTDRFRRESTDSHLRSSKAVTGYHIEASDGEIGHVDGFPVDDEAWAIRYIEVATRNWWPGKKVLVSPAWIERVSWKDSKVYVGLSREAIESAPEYAESTPITREYENRLYVHYGRPSYWLDKSGQGSSLVL